VATEQGALTPVTRSLDGTRRRRRRLRQLLGPGLITGASNEDPSSVGTYSQLGAQFGYGLAWTLLFTYPLLVAIQEVSARIGQVTGRGIAGNLKRHYPHSLAATLVALLAAANVINVAADLAAMGAVLRLLLGAPALLSICVLAVLSGMFETLTGYARHVRTLKWLCVSLLSYVVCAFAVNVPWGEVGRALIWPRLSADPQYLTAVVAALGTTISPYLFFWQAQQEVELGRRRFGAAPLLHSTASAPAEFGRIRIDTLVGMGLSSIVALFIVITTASTLHVQGVTTITTAAQAAEALRAVAGPFSFLVFALGIIGAGLLTLPALSGSAAYAVGELMSWRVGHSRQPLRARAYRLTVAAAMLIAVVLNFSSINPMRALYWSAVLNGVAAVPLMAILMRMSSRAEVMGTLTIPPGLRRLGWLATGAMAASVLGMCVAWLA
jgi:NRAMP (natural resistance-associated macrophage protein)-like metal ion transporter